MNLCILNKFMERKKYKKKSKILFSLASFSNTKNCLFFSVILINLINKFTSYNVLLPNTHFGNRIREIVHHSLYCNKNNKKIVLLFMFDYTNFIQKIPSSVVIYIPFFFFFKKYYLSLLGDKHNHKLLKLKNKKNKYSSGMLQGLLVIFINIEYLITRIFFLLVLVLEKLFLVTKKELRETQYGTFKITIFYYIKVFFSWKGISTKFFDGNTKDKLKKKDYRLRNKLSKSWYVEIPDYKFNERAYLEKKYKIPKNANFLCVHFRTSAYHNDKFSVRNVKTKNIKIIMNFLKKNYSYVVRVEDNKISISHNQKEKVFSQKKNNLDDLIFLKNCTHFVGSASGPIEFCASIGKSVLCLDLFHLKNCLWSHKDSITIAGYFNGNNKATVEKIIKFNPAKNISKKDFFLDKFLFKEMDCNSLEGKIFYKKVYTNPKISKVLKCIDYYISNKKKKISKTVSNELYFRNLTTQLNAYGHQDTKEYLYQAYKASGKLVF